MSSPTAEDQPPAEPVTAEPVTAEPITAEPVTVPASQDISPGLAAEEPAAASEDTPVPRPPFSKVAIAALPAGVLPLVPVGLGLGIAGLVTTRRGRRRGRGMAVAGLLTATTWLAVGITLVTVAALTHGFRKPTKIEYDNQLGTVFSLREGDCVNTSQNGTPSESITSCNSPHDAEVFATFPLPDATWPGTATVQQEADTGCSSRLAGYLNPELAISLSQDYVYPGQVAWQTGTRTVVCEVRATSGLLDQSVRAGSTS